MTFPIFAKTQPQNLLWVMICQHEWPGCWQEGAHLPSRFLCFSEPSCGLCCVRVGWESGVLCGIVSPSVREFQRVTLIYSSSLVNVHSVKSQIFVVCVGEEESLVNAPYHCLLPCLRKHFHYYQMPLLLFSSLSPEVSSRDPQHLYKYGNEMTLGNIMLLLTNHVGISGDNLSWEHEKWSY